VQSDRHEPALPETPHACFSAHNFICGSWGQCLLESFARVERNFVSIHNGISQQILPKVRRRLDRFKAQSLQINFVLGKNERTATISERFGVTFQNRFAALPVLNIEIA
jgi:hypothetical protein